MHARHYAIHSNVMSYTILICVYQDEITASYDYHSETISKGRWGSFCIFSQVTHQYYCCGKIL